MESSRRTIAYFSRLPHYSSLFTQEGFAREVSALKEAWQSNDAQRAMRAVSDEMVLTLSAAGTADDVAARVSALLKAGLKQAVLFPSRWMATPVAPSSGQSRPYHDGIARQSCLQLAGR